MKIICTQENLKGGLLTTGRIISPNNTLPILNNLLVKTENGSLKISSTNLELAITTQVRCKVEEPGEATVYGKGIIELVNTLPNANITLESITGELKVETEHYHTSIKTMPAEEFPLIPQIENKSQFSLPAQELKKAVDQVVFAVSQNQTQPEIAGVLLQAGPDVRVVATDRYRLAEKKLTVKNLSEPISVILPSKTCQEISRIIGNNNEDVQVSLNSTQAGLVIGSTQIVSRVVDGQYPDYQQIIPQQFDTQITCKRKDLINALRAGGIFSQSTSSVDLSYGQEGEALVLSAESSDFGRSRVVVEAKTEGQPGKLLLNFHYILDSLNVMESENVIIKVINESSPVIFTPEGQDDYLYLVMPIKN